MKPRHLIVSQQPQQSNGQQSLWMKVNCIWSNVKMYISDVNTVSHIWKSQSTVKMSSSHLTLFSHDFYFTCEQWVNYFMMLRDSMPLSRFPSRLIVPISLTCRWLAFCEYLIHVVYLFLSVSQCWHCVLVWVAHPSHGLNVAEFFIFSVFFLSSFFSVFFTFFF